MEVTLPDVSEVCMLLCSNGGTANAECTACENCDPGWDPVSKCTVCMPCNGVRDEICVCTCSEGWTGEHCDENICRVALGRGSIHVWTDDFTTIQTHVQVAIHRGAVFTGTARPRHQHSDYVVLDGGAIRCTEGRELGDWSRIWVLPGGTVDLTNCRPGSFTRLRYDVGSTVTGLDAVGSESWYYRPEQCSGEAGGMKVTFPPGFEEEERPDYDYDPELPVYGYEPGPPAAGSGSGAGHVVSEDNATKCTHDYASYAQMDWQKECQMSGGWTRLMPDARAGLLKTGGMGLQATTHAHTWVCHYSHRCASRFNSSQLTSGRKCDFSRRGRCGPQFNNITCGGGGAEPIPSWAVYCNEENGWCGITDAHRNAQASTAYDFEADSGGYCDGEDTNAVTAYSVRECLDECREAGYSSLLGTQFPDVFSGCCNKLSCAQACMSRVNGLSVHACQDLVHSVAAGTWFSRAKKST